MKMLINALLSSAVLALLPMPASGATLDDIKSRDVLRCGVNTGLPGFGYQKENGEWAGFDVDFCRAIAAAVFDDDGKKIEFTPLSSIERFTALKTDRVDLLARNTTWTMNRDTALGLTYVGVNYFDGQGFMVRRELNVTSALQLSGATICVEAGTTTELNMTDYFRINNMDFSPIIFETKDDVNKAYDENKCDVMTSDASGLYASRLALTNPDDHVVLPEIISKEPLGPVVRKGDEGWFDIVRWVLFGLYNAEELGVSKANVNEMLNSDDPDISRLLGQVGEFGKNIGLENDWLVKAIQAVGNYGEIFDRNIGPNTPLAIQRGLNALWTRGGLHYAPPIR